MSAKQKTRAELQSDYDSVMKAWMADTSKLYEHKRLLVAAREFVKYADLPCPGAKGDDVRFEVWRAELTKIIDELWGESDDD